MKLYNKRIAFLISDQHFIPHGGIGSFCKSFTEMCGRLNWKVDIILDKEVNDLNFKKLIEDAGANIIEPIAAQLYKSDKQQVLLKPESALPYTDHMATFAFSDTINFEKIINFRKSLIKAFTTNIYDMVVCNTQEAMSAAYAMTVNRYIPVVFYTHLHSMIFRDTQGSDVFLPSYHNFYNKHMEFNDIIIGTQSQKNIDELTKYGASNCALLPMPMSERGLLEAYNGEHNGVLFIGRWEEGKNPEAYIKVMKEANLPCKVMTNENGKKKFEKAFKEAGIADYEIRAGITGQEKIDFIRSSSVFFMPSLRENYPFAFLECLGHMPCVVLDVQDWSDNFDSIFYHKVHITNAANTIKSLYDVDQPSLALDYVKQLDNNVSTAWVNLVNNFASAQSKTDSAKINDFDNKSYAEYIENLDRKPHIAREDFESVLSNRKKFTVVYTDTDTYLSKDKNFVPPEKSEIVWDNPLFAFGE